jgi:hypothetical protein
MMASSATPRSRAFEDVVECAIGELPLPGSLASAGGESVTRVPPPAACGDKTAGFELAVGAGDCADGQAEVAGQLPQWREALARA